MNISNQEKVEELFLDMGRRVCGLIGWREAIGQVYALLYVRGEPLSLDDIAERAKLSKSNVWGIVQQLQAMGAVRKVWTTENRRDFFVAERDFNLIFTRGILPLLERKAALFGSYLDAARKELLTLQKDMSTEEEDSIKRYSDMLSEIANLKNKLGSLANILSTLGEVKAK